jgi:hypothetical protein
MTRDQEVTMRVHDRRPMPRFLGFVCLLACLAPAVAAAQGMAICERIGSNAERNQCVAAVARQRVDQPAVEICSRIGSNQDILECARAVAGQYMSPEAPALCGRIGSNQEIVECARALAGRTLDAGAVQVCGRVGSNTGLVDCARAIADKTYVSEELQMCNNNGSNQGIVDCLRSTGALPPPPQVQPAAPVMQSAWTVNLVNDSAGETVARVYVRANGATRWPQSLWRGSLVAGDQIYLNVNPGTWDLCVETADGFSSGWRGLAVDGSGTRLVLQSSRNDANVWSQMECPSWQ